MSDYDPIGEFSAWARALLFTSGALITAVALLACSDARPVAYYAKHANERAERIDACLSSGAETQDCRNAKQADFEARGIPAANGRATVTPAN